MIHIVDIRDWIYSIKVGEVKYGSLERNRVHALRVKATEFNHVRGYERRIYVHIHYDYDLEVACLVCVTAEEREHEKSNPIYKNEWKNEIPKNFD